MLRTLLVGAAALSLLFLVGCQREGPAERAGKKVDEAVDKAGDALKRAGEKLKEIGK